MSNLEKLALFGGPKSISQHNNSLFNWPILTEEDEEAVLRLMRKPNFEDEETVEAFEKEYAKWCGATYCVSFSSGTSAIQAAMFACGVRNGDEIIAPSFTYWATSLPCFSLGATMVFADIDPMTMCISPTDIEQRITEKTKAIVVTHLLGYPADMDAINSLASRYKIKVIEDAAHAHGSLYKGKKAGTLGDVAIFSLCGKAMDVGEGGVLVTNNKQIYEYSLAWAHNFKFNKNFISDAELLKFSGLPMGGVSVRMHNLSAAMGRVQLKYYDERMKEIDRSMNYFLDLLEDVPGIIPHRPPKESGSTMGAWYCPHALYDPSALEGLSIARFAEAIRAEGFQTWVRLCVKNPLHLHKLVNDCDIYNQGKPTRIANSNRDVRQAKGSLPVTESNKSFTIPWFKKFSPKEIEQYAACFKKVAKQASSLLDGDKGEASIVIDERGNG